MRRLSGLAVGIISIIRTVLGWIAALLWAVTDKEQTRRSPVANADQIAGNGLGYIKQGWRDPNREEGLSTWPCDSW